MFMNYVRTAGGISYDLRIDREVPFAEVSYSTTGETSDSVTVTLITNEEILTPSGRTQVDATTYTKMYASNTEGPEIVDLVDLIGNIGSTEVEIDWIVPAFDPTSIQLIAEITAANQTVRVNKYFFNNYSINR